MAKNTQNLLFNVNDSFSWTNYDCNCSTTFPEVGLNENIVLLPPNANTSNLVEINLPTADNGIHDNDANPVVGVIRKPISDKAPILLANNVPSNASFQLFNALGSLSQKDLSGFDVIPSNETLKVNNAISDISKEVVKNEGPSIPQEVVNEIKKEQINKEIVKSVQEVTTKHMESEMVKQSVPAAEAKQMSEHIAEAVAEKTEIKLKPSDSDVSTHDIKNITRKCVKQTLKEIGLPDAECDKHAETISTETATLVKSNVENTRPKEQEKIVADIIVIQPEVSKAIKETSNGISAVIESGSKVSVNNENNTVTVSAENKNAINNSINKVVDEQLMESLSKSTSSSVEKSVSNTSNNGTVVSIELNNNLSNALNHTVSEELTKNIVEKFINKLPEKFSQYNTKYVNKSKHVNMVDSDNKHIDLHKLIHSNIVERFTNHKNTSLYSNIDTSTKRIIELMDTSIASNSNNIVQATAEITQNGTNTNVVKVDTCTNNCNLNKPATADAIASVVAERLSSVNVSNISVETNPKNNQNNVSISATVPSNVNNEHVAQIIVDTVNRTSNVVKNQQNASSSSPDSLLTLIILALVGFIIYKLFIKK